jgi:hypothetical protein
MKRAAPAFEHKFCQLSSHSDSILTLHRSGRCSNDFVVFHNETQVPILAFFARVGRHAADSIMLVMPRGLPPTLCKKPRRMGSHCAVRHRKARPPGPSRETISRGYRFRCQEEIPDECH